MNTSQHPGVADKSLFLVLRRAKKAWSHVVEVRPEANATLLDGVY